MPQHQRKVFERPVRKLHQLKLKLKHFPPHFSLFQNAQLCDKYLYGITINIPIIFNLKWQWKNCTASFISICFIIPSDYFNCVFYFKSWIDTIGAWIMWKHLGDFHFDTVLNAIVKFLWNAAICFGCYRCFLLGES